MSVSVGRTSASGERQTMVSLVEPCCLVRATRTQTPIRLVISMIQNDVLEALNKVNKDWADSGLGLRR